VCPESRRSSGEQRRAAARIARMEVPIGLPSAQCAAARRATARPPSSPFPSAQCAVRAICWWLLVPGCAYTYTPYRMRIPGLFIADCRRQPVAPRGLFCQVHEQQIAKEKREAQGTRCKERRNAAPPSARKESPTFSNNCGLLAITSTPGTGPKTSPALV
jgi:hypothetical protein